MVLQEGHHKDCIHTTQNQSSDNIHLFLQVDHSFYKGEGHTHMVIQLIWHSILEWLLNLLKVGRRKYIIFD
jgi:hypothetical protein